MSTAAKIPQLVFMQSEVDNLEKNGKFSNRQCYRNLKGRTREKLDCFWYLLWWFQIAQSVEEWTLHICGRVLSPLKMTFLELKRFIPISEGRLVIKLIVFKIKFFPLPFLLMNRGRSEAVEKILGLLDPPP